MGAIHRFIRPFTVKFVFTSIMLFLMLNSTASAQKKWNHPGILHSAEQIAIVRSKIEAGEQPWKSAYEEMKKSPQSSLTYRPKARANVECGGHNNPNHGCDDMTNDARTAYTHALHWVLTDKQAHADKAIEILNNWARVHDRNTNKNAPLVVGWAGPHFINAAELLRYSNSGWKQSDIKAFEDYIKKVYISVTNNRTPPTPNWLFSILEVRMAVAIFTEDEDLWNESLRTWRHRIRTSIYQTSDGKTPVRFGDQSDAFMRKWWYGAWQAGVWVDGISQETCRDMPHNQMGLKGMTATAEMAWNQGVDLYGEEKQRLADYMEFHAKILMGDPRPRGLCTINKNNTRDTWEIGYNHLVNIKGMKLPNSLRVIKRIRPTESRRHMWAWETLTHADVGKYLSTQPQNYTLTTNVNGQGTVERSPDARSYDPGATVTLTATPSNGMEFSHWSGGATGTDNPLTVTMNTNRTVNAFFTPALPAGIEKLSIIAAEASAEQNDDHLKEFSYDGNLETRWANDNTLDNNWIIFDLGEPAVVNVVKLMLNVGETRSYPLKVEVGQSTDNLAEVWSGDLPPAIGLNTIVVTEATGRYVKVSMTGPNSDGSNWFSIFQAEVWGKNQGTSILSPSNPSMQSVSFNQIKGGFTVTAPGASAKLEVFDLKGKLLFQKSGLFENSFIPVRQNGVYFLRLSQGDKQINQRLVIQN